LMENRNIRGPMTRLTPHRSIAQPTSNTDGMLINCTEEIPRDSSARFQPNSASSGCMNKPAVYWTMGTAPKASEMAAPNTMVHGLLKREGGDEEFTV
jgi:hypothetical protein